MNEETAKNYGNHCLVTMEWLEERGLDANYLPEIDGENEYFVSVKQELPTVIYGNRQYS